MLAGLVVLGQMPIRGSILPLYGVVARLYAVCDHRAERVLIPVAPLLFGDM